MSLKRFYFDKNIEMCRTCMFIDEYTLNVNGNGEIPCGYDGTAICGIYEIGEKETSENRLFVSPAWTPCKKYKRCTAVYCRQYYSGVPLERLAVAG